MKKNVRFIVPITVAVILVGVASLLQGNMHGAADTNQLAGRQANEEQVAALEKTHANELKPQDEVNNNAIKGMASPKGQTPKDDEPEKIKPKKSDDDESGGYIGVPCILQNQEVLDSQLNPKSVVKDDANTKGQWYRN